MKLIIKYIGLLIFSGLILPFCNLKSLQIATAMSVKTAAQVANLQWKKPADLLPYLYPELADVLLPALKKLK
ncbi:hypothetical protein IDJ77_07440 [Mucilaginibacter sp. ZT4R22]|uniref:Uncharacterized protein n=1 Tax=Mucilaginibacter pankratovii TaxID=2772110 RepID=A0ABR7WMT1_9SPHI|nr:hypothetical protein [Mucilaginibacter pankratovii]MBD1363639.1 hypothetical protein [Mucilaginibacter pankratovii]